MHFSDITKLPEIAFKQNYLNCYTAVVLSIMQYIPGFFEILRSFSEVDIIAEVGPTVVPALTNLISMTAAYNIELNPIKVRTACVHGHSLAK